MFSINPNSGEPIYRQLTEQIKRLVAGGQLQPGSELPSVRELAAQYAINPMTISKAYSLLETEGLLERQRGKPMTIATASAPAQTEASRLQQLLPQLQQLALATHQLQLSKEIVISTLSGLLDKTSNDT
jgi:GntR family transcriptional regulator